MPRNVNNHQSIHPALLSLSLNPHPCEYTGFRLQCQCLYTDWFPRNSNKFNFRSYPIRERWVRPHVSTQMRARSRPNNPGWRSANSPPNYGRWTFLLRMTAFELAPLHNWSPPAESPTRQLGWSLTKPPALALSERGSSPRSWLRSGRRELKLGVAEGNQAAQSEPWLPVAPHLTWYPAVDPDTRLTRV